MQQPHHGPELPAHAEAKTTHEKLNEAVVSAAMASMQVVRKFQLGLESINRLADKSDQSILTEVDNQSERVAKERLSELMPEVPILGEETGYTEADSQSDLLFMVDPIDGTRPFLVGAPTSTVICAAYNQAKQRFETAAIGQPATGKLMYTENGKTYQILIDPETGEALTQPTECHVWEGSIEQNGTIFVENFAAFSRAEGNDKKLILGNDDLVKLFAGLQGKVAIENLGSNGMHHMLVAAGGETVVGAITTSMGGEWDTAGALAVLNAGGVAEGLRITKDRQTLYRADPLDPYSYDILISANNQQSLDFLEGAVVRCMNT